MHWFELIHTPTFQIWLLPFLIFFARIVDVSVDTLRIIYLSRDRTVLAPLLGFFEVLVWLLAVSQIIQNLTSPILYIAYASGYATGNYVGMLIERRLAFGNVILRIITKRDASNLIQYLLDNQYKITHLEAKGNDGNVSLIFMILKRKMLKGMLKIVDQYHPQAFYSIEDVRLVHEGLMVNPLAPMRIDPMQK